MICPICKRDVPKLTKDHIVPVSFTKLVGILRLKMRQFMKTKYQMICSDCNRMKDNRIDWEHPNVRNYMKTLAERILHKLNETK